MMLDLWKWIFRENGLNPLIEFDYFVDEISGEYIELTIYIYNGNSFSDKYLTAKNVQLNLVIVFLFWFDNIIQM